jgi:hypothetical protein
MPVVMGQPIVALCFLASAARISFIVTSLPVGIFLIISSTSIGAGITMVPVPHRLLMASVIFSTLGSPLLSLSLWLHVGFFVATVFHLKRLFSARFNQTFAAAVGVIFGCFAS